MVEFAFYSLHWYYKLVILFLPMPVQKKVSVFLQQAHLFTFPPILQDSVPFTV